jgi:hypothetical protein
VDQGERDVLSGAGGDLVMHWPAVMVPEGAKAGRVDRVSDLHVAAADEEAALGLLGQRTRGAFLRGCRQCRGEDQE